MVQLKRGKLAASRWSHRRRVSTKGGGPMGSSERGCGRGEGSEPRSPRNHPANRGISATTKVAIALTGILGFLTLLNPQITMFSSSRRDGEFEFLGAEKPQTLASAPVPQAAPADVPVSPPREAAHGGHGPGADLGADGGGVLVDTVRSEEGGPAFAAQPATATREPAGAAAESVTQQLTAMVGPGLFAEGSLPATNQPTADQSVPKESVAAGAASMPPSSAEVGMAEQLPTLTPPAPAPQAQKQGAPQPDALEDALAVHRGAAAGSSGFDALGWGMSAPLAQMTGDQKAKLQSMMSKLGHNPFFGTDPGKMMAFGSDPEASKWAMKLRMGHTDASAPRRHISAPAARTTGNDIAKEQSLVNKKEELMSKLGHGAFGNPEAHRKIFEMMMGAGDSEARRAAIKMLMDHPDAAKQAAKFMEGFR